MRLKSARLHPFGHFRDRLFELDRPLVVVHEPNDHGKTTLRHALFHALFTPSKLGKREFKAIQSWLPIPSGDYAEVTLQFEHAGATWTLVKRWGAGPRSDLSNGSTSIADSDKVQATLGDILAHGEATYRHVLFTGQGELAKTLESLKANAADVRDVGVLLKAAAGATADVDEQKLRRILDERIDEAFGRWDDTTGRPARDPQSGQERGLDNRWINGKGLIVDAWYDWKTSENARSAVEDLETRIDAAAAAVVKLERTIAAHDAFVTTHGPLREALAARATLEERIKRLETEEAGLKQDFAAWPRAEAAVEAWAEARIIHAKDIDALDVELADARKRAAGAATATAFKAIEQAKKNWDDARTKLAEHPHPGDETLAAITRLEASIKGAQLRIEAQSLSWRIEAETPRAATVTRGNQPSEPLAVGPSASSGSAQGRVQFAVDGVVIAVTSGEDDVDALFAASVTDEKSLAGYLAACGATTPGDARSKAEAHRRLAADVENTKTVYDGLLLQKSYEEWLSAVESLEKLPETRDAKTIEKELSAKRTAVIEGDTKSQGFSRSIAEWVRKHADLPALGTHFTRVTGELERAREDAKKGPLLPEGYTAVAEFVKALSDADAARIATRDELKEQVAALKGLTKDLGDRRSQDLVEEVETNERAFIRARARGRAYLRIREELDQIAAAGGTDPMVAFSETVATMFSRITGRDTTLAFDGALPASVQRAGVSLPHDRLGQGTTEALALVLRLAMAKAYVGTGAGFIMLDDPLVNLDRHRMAHAAEIIRKCSEQTQVIFFTCHDHHAAQLEGPAIGDSANPLAMHGAKCRPPFGVGKGSRIEPRSEERP